MTKLYKLATIPSTAAALFLTFFISSTFAQEMLEGVVRIKVSDALASQLQTSNLSPNAKGEVVTGHAPLDDLNRQFRIKRFTRVFPHAGKHEAKHRRYGLHLWYELRSDKSIPISSMLQSYQSETQILKAEPVYKKAVIGKRENDFGPRLTAGKALSAALSGSANDPMLAGQWHYNNTGQTGGTPGADIKLIDAWKIETGQRDVVIAVTDGGIQTDHVDLAANMWINTGEVPGNNSDDDNNGYVDDVHGYSFVEGKGKITAGSHATHVGGTIAAVTNNGIGVAGVAGGSNTGDGVRLMSCAVFLNDSADGFAEAYVYSADNGAVISQNSWGYMLPDVYETVVLEAIDYFIAEAGKDENGVQTGPMKGGLVIFSAGNDNTDANFYPAFYERVLAVASSTHRDMKAQYSNFGAWVDITAPGGETYETEGLGVLSTLPGNQYGYFMGTSMACPHISGVAGLVLSKFGGAGFTPEMLRERILRSVDNIDSLNTTYAGQLGSGRINAARALAQNENIPPDAITDLSVTGKNVGEITLTWTSPSDPNDFAARYDLRYATSPITETSFNAAKIVAGLSSPKPAGSKETFTVKNLSGGNLLYFAIRSADFDGNISPISNVVSQTSVPTPSIVITPASLSERLKTAERSTLTFSIRNEGKGPLNFSLLAPEPENTFYKAEPVSGTVSATDEQIITVTFDASGLLTGTYQEDIIVQHDDPDKASVAVHLTLQVTNNGSPIASVDRQTVDFSSVTIGSSVIRSVIVSNKGSDALVISQAVSSHPDFRADMPLPLSIAAFSSAAVRLIFSPSSEAAIAGAILLHTNDPSSPVLQISLNGEGLQGAPITASPGFFDETLQQGAKITRTMVLKNNGSQERAYRLEVMNYRQATSAASASGGRRATHADSTNIAQRHLLRERQTAFAARRPAEKAILETIAPPSYLKKSNAAGRKSQASVTETKRYATGFENFIPGFVGEQNGWYATNNWHISGENPDRGNLHLQGTSIPSGEGQHYVLSPYLFEEYDYPHYTTTTMRINADRARGSSWEIVPQDPWSYIATRIRFNADGTIDALVIDNDYAFHWKRVPATKPSGYFELAVEYNNWGSDTSGFPTYHLFINNRQVFSGTGLASGIGQVAITSSMETSGRVLDVDEFEIIGAGYVPQFITATPREGVIPAGKSVNLNVVFDASGMKAGMYEADLHLHVDATDTLTIPAALTVTDNTSMAGKILWEKWTGIPGVEIASIPVTVAPDSTRLLPLFESPSNTGDNYGSRMRGYVEAPFSGNYTFWIASNDNSELWLGTDESVGSKRKIASVNGYTNPRQWEKYATQRSAQIYLVANRRYYIEALHKESVGTDHIAVGWQLPDQSVERPIAGMRLFPYSGETIGQTCAEAGLIMREQWNDVPGDITSSIPLEKEPSFTETITVFESPLNIGDHYGTRIRGFLCVPVSGKYTFWISGNDMSELWLSTDSGAANKKRIAHVPGYTDVREWTKYPSQRSTTIELIAGQKYYVEALHKEGVGTDHIAVGWQLPDGTLERPIPGIRLLPFHAAGNNLPLVQISSPNPGDSFVAPATVSISAEASDPDGHIAKVEFFAGARKLGEDSNAPYAVSWDNVPEGEYDLTATAIDNRGAVAVSARVRVNVQATCTASGSIIREYWMQVPGDQVSKIPVNTVPDGMETLPAFEAPANTGTNFGARIRGYICPPQTGNYHFWIASNDQSELSLSTDSNPENRVKIAALTRATGPRQWDTFSTQRSQTIFLVQGKTYYIEALHKQGVGTDHLAVGWQLPDGTMERPIAGNRLSPLASDAGSMNQRDAARSMFSDDNTAAATPDLILYPNPLTGDKLTIVVENLPLMKKHVGEIEIRQLTGLSVLSQTVNDAADYKSEITITKNLPSGVYIVQVRIDGIMFTEKLVIP